MILPGFWLAAGGEQFVSTRKDRDFRLSDGDGAIVPGGGQAEVRRRKVRSGREEDVAFGKIPPCLADVFCVCLGDRDFDHVACAGGLFLDQYVVRTFRQWGAGKDPHRFALPNRMARQRSGRNFSGHVQPVAGFAHIGKVDGISIHRRDIRRRRCRSGENIPCQHPAKRITDRDRLFSRIQNMRRQRPKRIIDTDQAAHDVSL
jgi:hypothetical protein